MADDDVTGGVHRVVPDLISASPEQAATFYTGVLGMRVVMDAA